MVGRMYVNARLNAPPRWFPSRLLHLQRGTARLIDTTKESPTGSYAMLSHCWGGDLRLKFTFDNYALLSKGLCYNKFKPSLLQQC